MSHQGTKTQSLNISKALRVILGAFSLCLGVLVAHYLCAVRTSRKPFRPKKSSLIIGPAAIMAAMKEGKPLDRIYVQNRLQHQHIIELTARARELRIPVNYVPVEKLNSFNAGEHQGAIAQISKVSYYELQDVISQAVEDGRAPMLLMLDGITDVRNIGAIARTAYCMGVDAIVIPDKGVGALNEEAVLTSAGALEQIAICRVNSLMKAVDEMHANGIEVLASEMTATASLFELDLKTPVCFIMGSEDNGIYPALMKQCDKQFNIPMHHNFESLNVSVATGMILYEAMKQRRMNG